VRVRDTGWEHPFGAGNGANRTVGTGSLSVRRIGHATWEWRMCGANCPHFPEHDGQGECDDVDAAKSAAEDALRELCRETLKALGDSDA